MGEENLRCCGFCGGPLRRRREGGSTAPGFACRACGRRTYRNPAVGVAVVLVRGGRILLGRRARGKYAGLWCIPCGYVEWDEPIRAAARREMAEETGLDVEIRDVCAVHSNFHDPARQTVGVWFRGRVRGGALAAGDDLDKAAYFRLGDPPDLAFPTDRVVIEELARRARSRRARRRWRRSGGGTKGRGSRP